MTENESEEDEILVSGGPFRRQARPQSARTFLLVGHATDAAPGLGAGVAGGQRRQAADPTILLCLLTASHRKRLFARDPPNREIEPHRPLGAKPIAIVRRLPRLRMRQFPDHHKCGWSRISHLYGRPQESLSLLIWGPVEIETIPGRSLPRSNALIET